MNKLYFANPSRYFHENKKKIKKSIYSVLLSNYYIGGPIVEQFEKKFAQYNKAKYAISCNSGTDAIFLALKAIGIKYGDEVILPSHSAVATATAVKQSGAKLVFADIDKKFYTIDEKKIIKLITSKTKAIIAVHMYGQACNIDEIKKISKQKNLFLIEDCAQSLGTKFKKKKVGTFGDIGCFSFYPTKNLGAIGDGGCVITNNYKIKKKISSLKNYGWNAGDIIKPGINSRLDPLQASILLTKLKTLDQDLKTRQRIANKYFFSLKKINLDLPQIRNNCFHSFHLFVIKINNRDKFINFFKKKNIFLGIHYKKPIHLIHAFKNNTQLKNTENLYKKIVTLPLYPELKKFDQDRVIKFINEYLNEN